MPFLHTRTKPKPPTRQELLDERARLTAVLLVLALKRKEGKNAS
jgi:hypothetical protein